MTNRSHPWLAGLAAVMVSVSLGSNRTIGQEPAANASNTKPDTLVRMSDGRPDLQGVWNFSTVTPMERPAELADKEFFTPEEAATFEQQQAVRRNRDTRNADTQIDIASAYNDSWYDYGTKVIKTRRTSLITDPRDGRLPPMTVEARERQAVRAEMIARGPGGPEDFSLSDRCILGINSGPPMIPGPYNNNVQLLQSRDYIVVYNEMVHNARMIPLDGRPPLGRAIRQHSGYSRGRWEGDTLVVETANFTGTGASSSALRVAGTDENLHLIERFTRTDADTLLYEFTIAAPAIWTRPWSAAMTMSRTDEPIYEYACHEGNYSLAHMLANARGR